MLEKISKDSNSKHYMDFSNIQRYSSGSGLCFVYNAVLKSTKAGKPFVTLYLRDTAGRTIPGYIFDLSSPIVSGADVTAVIGSIVKISWQENYLHQVGLTVIIDKCEVARNVTPDEYAVFTGAVEGLPEKLEFLQRMFIDVLGVKAYLPKTLEVEAVPEYAGGRVGGLGDFYFRIAQQLEAQRSWHSDVDYKQLIATFLIYILAHSNYVVSRKDNSDDICLVRGLTEKVSAMSTTLNLSEGALEIIHMFFGYVPKDIYVRTITAVSDMVKRVEDEFSLYKTIPLTQEGNAGYGSIKRYSV